MSGRITWVDVYRDFQLKFPNWSKEAIHYRPNGYMSIIVFLSDGSKIVYDGLARKGNLVLGSVS